MEKIILGVDPGTNIMGYGLIKVANGKAQMLTMGVIDLRKMSDAYMKLGHIFKRITGIIDSYLPDEMAIEAPFFGKNVQSMLKLGRGLPSLQPSIMGCLYTNMLLQKSRWLSRDKALPLKNRWRECSNVC